MKSEITNYIIEQLKSVADDMSDYAQKNHKWIANAPERNRLSINNFLNYLSLRSHDIRVFQDLLHRKGLSSLAGSESHSLRQVQKVLKRLGCKIEEDELSKCSFGIGRKLLADNATVLFGEKSEADIPYLMVTLDSSFLQQPNMIADLLERGMSVARINCAHDDSEIWSALIREVKIQSERLNRPCKIYMDLAGPKIRTYFHSKKIKKLILNEGDELLLAENPLPKSSTGKVVGCTLEGITAMVKVGERVMFDDGEIETEVIGRRDKTLVLKVKRNSKVKKNLKSEKGINFPDSELTISSLTDYDRKCLSFVKKNADLVGFSFVKTVDDVKELQEALKDVSYPPKIILKIETPQAVNHLPQLLLQGLQHDTLGIMIARGDLAVEIGFERMSEIQDEILWFCEAAHVPVIWATQVLENLHKKGIATRSEITDAAHAVAAECIMINKGSYTLKVIDVLSDILQRTGGHRAKKRYYMRPLSIATNFVFE
ncbi:MAG: pyruvate kinase [Capnocytophaga sp.]|nr:pyruvate kinase [Capnocytophaga sp.]